MRLSHSYSSIKLYENCPLRYYRQRILKDVVDEGGEASKHGERIHAFLENRLKTDQLLPQEVAHYEPLCSMVERLAHGGQLEIEKELVLTENLTPTGWWDSDAWLRSKLDVLVINGNDAIVMDWKTGKRKADFFQMQMFAAQVFKHYPEVVRVKTILVWLKTLEQDTETYNRVNINEVWAEIMKRIQRIHSSVEHDNWPAKPSGLCRFCPCRHNCDFARV
jgi:CRISPR/Cas system-associated exonuclease Cas4 (RecB family)